MNSIPPDGGPASAGADPIPAAEPGPFPSWLYLLLWMVGRSAHLAVGRIDADGKKTFAPAPITPESLRGLLQAHLDGALPPITCVTQAGDTHVVSDAFGLGAYTTGAVEAEFVCTFMAFDIDGPDHTSGRTAAEVERVMRAIVAVLADAGIPCFVVRSSGGQGRHVVVLFPDEVPAAFAIFLGDQVLALVPHADDIEVFPCQATLRDGQPGSLVALPKAGRPPKPGGSEVIDLEGRPVSVESIHPVPGEVLCPLLSEWKQYDRLHRRRCDNEAALSKMRSILAVVGDGEEDWSDVGLEAVAREYAVIRDDRQKEGHIIRINCPRHGGDACHLAPDQGWYKCHKCEFKHAGPMAPYFLLKEFFPQEAPNDLKKRLVALRQRRRDQGQGAAS